MEWAIQTSELSKTFPAQQGWRSLFQREPAKHPAVDGVTINVRQGELFGLLGPNGAGKTTLIKILMGLILPTHGKAQVNGFSLEQAQAIKATTGLVTSDERSFYWRLTGRQNLEFFASLHGLFGEANRQRVNEILELVQIKDIADQRFLTYSSGMRQRLCIARALLNQPRLLFLDEPTKGLDPTAAAELHQLIRSELIGRGGMTAFMSTHNLEEAEIRCDRIAIMHLGRLRACGTIHELRSGLDLNERFLLSVSGVSDLALRQLAEHTTGIEVLPVSVAESSKSIQAPVQQVRVTQIHGATSLDDALHLIRSTGGLIVSAQPEEIPLEKVFTRYTRPGANELSTPNQTVGIETQQGTRASDAPPALPRQVGLTWPLAMAFLRRDWLSEISYPLAFSLQIVSILLSVSIFYFIGEMLGDTPFAILAGYGGDYFAFVLVGIAFASYFGVGLSSFANSLRHAQTTGTLEAMLSTPIRISAMILASSFWDYLLTTVRVLVYLGFGGLLLGVDLSRGNYPTAILILLVTLVVFSGVGIIAASFIMVLKRGDPIAWALSAFSNLLGGVYYPLDVLPDWLQFLARLLPITYSLEAMRQTLLNGASLIEVAPQLAALAAFGVILLPTSLIAFRFAVRRARQDGSLTHY